MAEKGDENTMYLRGKPQAYMQFTIQHSKSCLLYFTQPLRQLTIWPYLQGKTPSGGGGLLSTGNDYIKFAECLTRGGVSESGFRWRIRILPENAGVVKIQLGHIADCCGRRPWI